MNAGVRIFLVVGLLIAALAPAGADEGAVLEGRILDAVSGAPVEEAVVVLLPGARVAIAAAGGRFSFAGVAPGAYFLQVQHLAYRASSFGPFTPEPGGAFGIELRLDRAPFEETVVVRPSPPVITARATPGPRVVLTRAEAAGTAGTFGDPARALTALPGVAAANDYKADLRLKGGEPDDVIYRLDGVSLTNPYHFRWARASGAALNLDAFDRFTVRTSGLPAEVGDTLSGTIELVPAERGVAGRTVDVSVGTLASSLAGVGPAGDGGSWVAAGRYSNLALYRSLYGADRFEIPAYADLLVRARVPLRPGFEFVAGGLALENRVAMPGASPADSKDLGAAAATGYVGIDRSGEEGGRLSVRLAGAGSRQRAETGAGGDLEVRGRDLRLAIDWQKEAASGSRWRAGAESVRLTGAIEGTVPEMPELQPLDARSLRGGAYAAWGLDLSRSTSIEIGLRADRDSRFGPSGLQPRVRADYATSSGRGAHLAFSRYAAYPRLEQEFLARGEILGVTTADELSAGATFPLAGGVSTEINIYTQRSRDRVAEVVNRHPDVPEPMGRFERGRLDGVELALRQEGDRLRSRLAVTLLRARLVRDGQEAPANGDQPYRIDGAIAYPLRAGWSLVARLQAASGLPYTSDEPADAGGVIPGSLNGRRLPAYARLDLRAEWEGRFRGARARAYLEIDNALGRENVRGRELEWDAGKGGYVTRDELSMPLVPGFGIELSWGGGAAPPG